MPGPVKEASSGHSNQDRRNESNSAVDDAESPPGSASRSQRSDEHFEEVFGDTGTNLVMLALVVIAWISQWAEIPNCTC